MGHLNDIEVVCSLLGSAPDARPARWLAELRAQGFRREVWVEHLAARLEVGPRERAARVSTARAHAGAAFDRAARAGIGLLPVTAAAYPSQLGRIVDPPIVLWHRGQVEVLAAPAVAVVGARAATPGGRAMAYELGRDLARAGLVVVSGMARGIDGAAHLGAIDAGGCSIAVLGCGVDVIYPREHAALAARLVERGAIVSEFAPGTLPLPPHFPRRNRIISGLALAVVVVEASEKSGSLITARLALEQGRDVLAVPGNAASGCYRGSHGLIKDGARLVETVKDVLEEIRWVPAGAGAATVPSRPDATPLEAAMRAGQTYSVEDLSEQSGRPVQEILSELSALELEGRVRHHAGGHFVRVD